MGEKYPLEQSAEFFNDLEQKKDITFKAFSCIQETINFALKDKSYDQLLNLIPYMESGQGHYAFRYIGEARRIFRILNIIALEKKYNKKLFCSDCPSLDALMEKYVLVLFALRRILFQLSETSVEEAFIFLFNQALTPFSIYILTRDELIVPTDQLYKCIFDLYQEAWTNDDIDLFQTLINSNTNKNE